MTFLKHIFSFAGGLFVALLALVTAMIIKIIVSSMQ